MTGTAVVTFDCWNTLLTDLEPGSARARQVAAVDTASGGELGTIRAAAVLDRAVAEHTAAWRAGRHHGVARIAARIGADLGLAPAASAALADELAALDGASVAATPGALETFDLLRSAGYRLALVCDTGLHPGSVVRGLLEQHGLLEPLASLAFSDEVGVPKPDRAIFAAALEPLGGDPARSVHVGDLVATDVVGARDAGMRSVLFTGITPAEVAHTSNAATPDHTIDHLTDLPAVLEDA